MDIVEIYGEGKKVLEKNSCIALPPIVASIIAGVFSYHLGRGVSPSMLMPTSILLAKIFLFALATGVLSLVAEGMSIIMSYEALETGKTSLDSGITKVMQRFGSLIITAILIGVLVGVGVFFFVIPGLLAIFFLMFAIPIVVLEDLSSVEAMGKSYRLVRDNIGSAFIYTVIAIFVIMIGGVIGKILEIIPLIGKLILSPALSGAVMAYLYTVLTVFYREVKA